MIFTHVAGRMRWSEDTFQWLGSWILLAKGEVFTPWKINGWNLPASPIFSKENDLNHPPPWWNVPAVNLQGCKLRLLHLLPNPTTQQKKQSCVHMVRDMLFFIGAHPSNQLTQPESWEPKVPPQGHPPQEIRRKPMVNSPLIRPYLLGG